MELLRGGATSGYRSSVFIDPVRRLSVPLIIVSHLLGKFVAGSTGDRAERYNDEC
jgi:hypothetical protein